MKRMIAIVLIALISISFVSASAVGYRDKAIVKQVQQALNDAGYDCGLADGFAGKRTKAAIIRYQTDKGLTVSGSIDDELLDALGINGEYSATSSGETEDDSPAASVPTDSTVTGTFDEPALINPEERYETFFEKTDSSEYGVYVLLDQMNDESADIEEYGALYITLNEILNDSGEPLVQVKLGIQDCPYGKVLVVEDSFLWMKNYNYFINTYMFIDNGKSVERTEGFSQDEYEYYCESYHFPYGNLEILNGIRQDENGYIYFLIKSEDFRSFEFVVGEQMRIVQLRVYEKNDDGELALASFVDYDVGPAGEIPQRVLDAMGEVLTPVEK